MSAPPSVTGGSLKLSPTAPLSDDLKAFRKKHGFVPQYDASNFDKIGGQKGSNLGGLYRRLDDKGNAIDFYVKEAQSAEHAMSEVVAAKLYRAAGMNIPDVELGMINGKPAVFSRYQPLQKFSTTAANIAKAQEGFAVDALLGNWDVMGASFDNIFIDAAGNVVRLDTGGALFYRAQGAKKGLAWNGDLDEFNTLRSASKAPQASQVFGGMSDTQLLKSVDRALQSLTPTAIDDTISAVYRGPNKLHTTTLNKKMIGTELRAVLMERRDRLLQIRTELSDAVEQAKQVKATISSGGFVSKKSPKGFDIGPIPDRAPAFTGREAAGAQGKIESWMHRDLGSMHKKRKKHNPSTYAQDWKEWSDSLNSEERRAIAAWTGGQYGKVRAAQGFRRAVLNASEKTMYVKMSKTLQAAMQRAPRPAKTEVFRTFHIKDADLFEQLKKATKPGDNWTMEATASFSESRTQSRSFGRYGSDQNIMIRVKTDRGVWVDPISNVQGELEHIMMNGEKFRVVAVRELKGGKVNGMEIYLEERD